MVRRRGVLQRLGALTVAGAVAGCQGEPEFEGEPSGDGQPDDESPGKDQQSEPPDRVEFPELSAGEPAYREWIPPKDLLDLGLVFANNLSRVRERREQLPADEYQSGTRELIGTDYFGVPFERLDGQIAMPLASVTVYFGRFDRSEIAETLRATGYEVTDSRSDVTIYSNADREGRFAVADSGVIEARGPREPGQQSFGETAVVLFETAAGQRTRRYETSESFRRFADEVGWPLGVVPPIRASEIELGDLENVIPESAREQVHVGSGSHTTGTATVRRWWLWAPAEGATRELLEASVADASYAELASEGEDVAVRQGDGVSEIALVATHEETGGGVAPPIATVEATLNDGTLVLEHLAGEAIPLEHVVIEGRETTYRPSGTLEPGDSLRIDEREFGGTVDVKYSQAGEVVGVLATATDEE